ncbi:MAG: PQQ-dependent sugar dehydrogenase [Paracoccus sp. (in: a-proteobacteria)]|nr:PQQ-dependent sugar dehydrogenase [Paracoccus sp. (in: a-proteobacteria)]
MRPIHRSSLTITAATAALFALAAPLAAEPVPTGPPNAPDQEPAFPEQTRAPELDSGVSLAAEEIAGDLEHPWAVALLPGGDALVTERPGRMRYFSAEDGMSEPLSGLPEIVAARQGGLLDVTLSPDFDNDRMVYFSFSEPRENDNNGTSVARGTLSDDNSALENVEVIFQAEPGIPNNMHYGSRVVFAPDGNIFVTLGERSDQEYRVQAQDPQSHLGKLIRITPEGEVPDDNPYADGEALPEIYAMGFRNVQAAAIDADGQLWTIEHGPRGGDELNRPEAGKNYGWPTITYGVEYAGGEVGAGLTEKEGMEQPVYYWDPVIAPSGAAFYEGEMFSDWEGSLLIGAMNPPGLVRLELDGDRVSGEERFDPEIGRIRDVAVSAEDGAIWVVTDEESGGLYRLSAE